MTRTGGIAIDAARVSAVGFRDPTVLTRALVMLLWIIIAADAAGIVSSGLTVMLLESIQQHAYASIEAARADALANDARQHLIGTLQIILAIVTAIAFFCWVYRANANARQLGAAGMDSSPGWAVGSFFIPLMNLWMPYRAMREIWQASAAPGDWKNHPGGVIVPVWWAFFLLSSVAGQVALFLAKSGHDMSSLIVAAYAAMICNGITVVGRLVTLVLVGQIHRMQMAHARAQSLLAALD